MDQVVDFIDRGLQLAKEAGKISGPKLMDFKKVLHEEPNVQSKVAALKEEIEHFSKQFPLPGYPEY